MEGAGEEGRPAGVTDRARRCVERAALQAAVISPGLHRASSHEQRDLSFTVLRRSRALAVIFSAASYDFAYSTGNLEVWA